MASALETCIHKFQLLNLVLKQTLTIHCIDWTCVLSQPRERERERTPEIGSSHEFKGEFNLFYVMWQTECHMPFHTLFFLFNNKYIQSRRISVVWSVVHPHTVNIYPHHHQYSFQSLHKVPQSQKHTIYTKILWCAVNAPSFLLLNQKISFNLFETTLITSL